MSPLMSLLVDNPLRLRDFELTRDEKARLAGFQQLGRYAKPVPSHGSHPAYQRSHASVSPVQHNPSTKDFIVGWSRKTVVNCDQSLEANTRKLRNSRNVGASKRDSGAMGP